MISNPIGEALTAKPKFIAIIAIISHSTYWQPVKIIFPKPAQAAGLRRPTAVA
jgi:hypothetical protein